MSTDSYSPYTDAFKEKVVDSFVHTFEVLGVSVSRAAQQTATTFGIARTTVIAWAQALERMPQPTWGMIYAKNDEILLLKTRISELESTLSEATNSDERMA